MKNNRRWIILGLLLIFVVFIYVSTQKNGEQYGDVSMYSFTVKSVINYSNLSAACFVIWYQNGYIYKMGQISFRFIYAVMSAFGINVEVLNTTSGGTFIGIGNYTTNAFTVARNYIEDFGVLYMALMLLLFGMIHGYVYKKAKTETGVKRIRYALLNAMLFIPLAYQILTDQYLSTIPGWIQYTIWICIFTSRIFFANSVDKVTAKEL
jgi:oligosaccharide repeat unit polymerase